MANKDVPGSAAVKVVADADPARLAGESLAELRDVLPPVKTSDFSPACGESRGNGRPARLTKKKQNMRRHGIKKEICDGSKKTV